MTAFRFRLQTLLRLRMADRDQRRAELAQALAAERVLLEQIASAEAELAEARARSQGLTRPGALNVDSLLQSSRYELLLRAKAQGFAQQRQQVQAEIDRRRQTLVEADRQLRVLEQLRLRQQQAHDAQELHREAKRLDEAATTAAARRQEAAP